MLLNNKKGTNYGIPGILELWETETGGLKVQALPGQPSNLVKLSHNRTEKKMAKDIAQCKGSTFNL